MVDNRERYLVTRESTGELVSVVHEGYRVVDKALYENWVCLWKLEGVEAYNMGAYVKMAASAAPVLRDMGLTKIERGLVDLFVEYLRWNTNRIAYRNGKRISVRTMSLKLGTTEKEVRKAMTTLRNKGIVGGDLYLNPYYIFKGEFTRAELREMFEGTAFHRAWEDTIGRYLEAAEEYRQFAERQEGRANETHGNRQKIDGGACYDRPQRK